MNNPVVRLSNNQLCGFVEISGDTNPELKDQTNRGGLIQNRAFEDLRRLVLFVIQILETERQLVRHPKRKIDTHALTLDSREGDERSVISELGEFSCSLDHRSMQRLLRITSRLEKSLATQRKLRDTELSAYADLAALGHSVGYLHHSLRPRLESLTTGMKKLRSHQNTGLPDTSRSFSWPSTDRTDCPTKSLADGIGNSSISKSR